MEDQMAERTGEQIHALAEFELERVKAAQKRERARKRMFGITGPLMIFGPIFIVIGLSNSAVPRDVVSFAFSLLGAVTLGVGLGDVTVVLRRQAEDMANLRDRLEKLELARSVPE
jgi:hypothetical protein